MRTVQEKVLEDIDFKSLAKELKGSDVKDISNLMSDMMKKIINEMLKAELEEHLESNPNTSKNGSYTKRVRSDEGELEIEVPRDRKSEYKPQLIPKGNYTINGLDEKIISMYARGMSQRDIEKTVYEMYGIEVSDSLVSKITDKIIPELEEWKNRRLEPIYPIVYMDAMVFKIKDDTGFYKNRALHFVLGFTPCGVVASLGRYRDKS